tara:strand:+ start:254 stop:460 length:207 start_codon:yes stop_codon:yes gene_type:complete
MWIPVVIIAWSLNGTPTWINFPMITFPFKSLESCSVYIKRVKSQVTLSADYVSGYSICIEVPKKGEPV